MSVYITVYIYIHTIYVCMYTYDAHILHGSRRHLLGRMEWDQCERGEKIRVTEGRI